MSSSSARAGSQFSERLAYPLPSGSPLRVVFDAVVTDPAGDHSLARMADRASVSDRHLTRLFAEQTGTSPARFVERVRVEAARDLLETGDATVACAAERCGFGSAETMRRAFRRVLAVTPTEIRARFRSTG